MFAEARWRASLTWRLACCVLGVCAALCALIGEGCGGATPPPVHVDPYEARVAGCVLSPRPQSDAAQGAMVPIAAGVATLGSTPAERAQARRDLGTSDATVFEDEAPLRRLPMRAFRVDPVPVTNGAFAEFVEACGQAAPDRETITPSFWQAQASRYALTVPYEAVVGFLWPGRVPTPSRAQHPVVLVDHDQAGFYCAWRGARLPTADEWERAARGPNGLVYPWGERYDPFRVHSGVRDAVDTTDVGSLPQGASPEGVLDMGGHVFEWTATKAPAGHFLVKGNGFGMPGGYGRGAASLARPKDLRHVRVGFRCATD